MFATLGRTMLEWGKPTGSICLTEHEDNMGAQQLEFVWTLSPPERVVELQLTLEKLDKWTNVAMSLINCGVDYTPTCSPHLMFSTPLPSPYPMLTGSTTTIQATTGWSRGEVWSSFSRGGASYILVPEEHTTLMDFEYVPQFQKIFRSRLEAFVMYGDHDSVGSLATEDQLISLRGQINEIKKHIDLLMIQSAIIRERRCLLQHQQDIKSLATTEQLDFTCLENSSVDLIDIKSTQDSVVPSPSLVLKGAADFSASPAKSESIVVRDDLCVAAFISYNMGTTWKTIPSDNAAVVVQPSTQSQGSASKLRAIPRRYKPGRREFQGRSARHEPPALFQGWADASSSMF
ncbi:uncharacterized protein F5147DRAFT_777422 [Suillus discolor]|uniref:Uncharacterized protein n=1 Tax=Suillus discolor TaxID=1912936 RepID=A0A9P7F0J4_9AGAM|nr:uncharacterized protein F5147DRAFT_777422 [Suillus discolor]KAG2099301.1 hypothetical protein F5147DRAFT_777422 [Suillus discolor]